MENNTTLTLHFLELCAIPAVGWVLSKVIEQAVGRLVDKINKVQKEIDDHKIECDKINKEVLATRLEVAEKEISAIRRFNHWVGNTLSGIGAKLDIIVERRPDSDDI